MCLNRLGQSWPVIPGQLVVRINHTSQAASGFTSAPRSLHKPPNLSECDRLSTARQEGTGESACSKEGGVRELWLEPCADGELGAALYSNAAFAALKCTGSRNQDPVCIAAVVRPRPRHDLLTRTECSCALLFCTSLHPAVWLSCAQRRSCRTRGSLQRKAAYPTSQLRSGPAGRAHMHFALPAAVRPVLFWQAAVCALRELLQWRSYAGLYEGCQLRSAEGGLVHMKARLRALEAFERLGNWGQVRWAPHRPARCCLLL